MIPYIDYRPIFKKAGCGMDLLCTKCGDVFLVDISSRFKIIFKCRHCGFEKETDYT